MSELQRLRDRVEELEALLGLTEDIPDEIVPAELAIRSNHNGYFGPKVKAIIGMLLARPFVTASTLYDAIYGALPEADQPNPRNIPVLLSRSRKIMRAHGVEITTMWGKGWYLDGPNKQKLAAIVCRLRSARDAA
jgi:hypothetical protein